MISLSMSSSLGQSNRLLLRIALLFWLHFIVLRVPVALLLCPFSGRSCWMKMESEEICITSLFSYCVQPEREWNMNICRK